MTRIPLLHQLPIGLDAITKDLKELILFLKVPMITTESGLQYKDIKVGAGPSPPVGFQVCLV